MCIVEKVEEKNYDLILDRLRSEIMCISDRIETIDDALFVIREGQLHLHGDITLDRALYLINGELQSLDQRLKKLKFE